jgi:hypothetical protein
MRTDHLDSKAWELEADETIALRKKLSASGTALGRFTNGEILYGIKTGLTAVFAVDENQRQELIAADSRSKELLWAFVQGTNMRPWYVETPTLHLIALKSSNDYTWPWAHSGADAESVFKECYPAVYDYLLRHKNRLEKRSDQGKYWWELRSCAYWDEFPNAKVVWPDITNRPRFSMDLEGHAFGDTAFMVPNGDFYLLGVLNSWATWFFISKTAQPLRLRSDRWQYRLKTQYMQHIPIPDASQADRTSIGAKAQDSSLFARGRYELETSVQHRLQTTFGESASGEPLGKLNQKAQGWWEISPNQLGAALKTSFKLASNPMQNPRTADEWEPYLAEKRAEVERLSRELADAEAEINERVFRLFDLTPDEIALLQKEVEH